MIGLTACSTTKEEEKDALTVIKEQGYMTMATSPDFAPYEFMNLKSEDGSEIVGCDVELGKYIAEYIGVDLKIESMDFDACQAATSMGKVDMSISGYAKTAEREENMGCSDFFNYAPDSELSQGIIILKENADTLKTAADFDGKSVATQNGSLQYNLTTEQLPNTTTETISSINDGVMMLLSEKVAGVASSYDTGLQILKNYDELQMCEFVFEIEDSGNIVIAPKGETALMEEINKALAKAEEEDMYQKWLAEATILADELAINE